MYGLHPIESAIEKLHIIAKEKEVQRSEHRRKQEEEEKLLKRTKVKKGVEKSRERRHVEYSTIGYKVFVAVIIIFGMCRREVV